MSRILPQVPQSSLFLESSQQDITFVFGMVRLAIFSTHPDWPTFLPIEFRSNLSRDSTNTDFFEFHAADVSVSRGFKWIVRFWWNPTHRKKLCGAGSELPVPLDDLHLPEVNSGDLEPAPPHSHDCIQRAYSTHTNLCHQTFAATPNVNMSIQFFAPCTKSSTV